MNNKISVKVRTNAVSVWKSVINLIASDPRVLLPFLFLALIECALLAFVSLSPHFPVNKIMAAPISRIWGALYLHYPYFYELLPKVFYYVKILSGIFLGSFMAGVGVLTVAHVSLKKRVNFKKIAGEVLKRYVSLLILAFILLVGVHFLMKLPPIVLAKYFKAGHAKLLWAGPKYWFILALPIFRFLLAIVLQALIVYAIPFIVLKKKKFLAAFWAGIRFFFSVFLRTLLIVAIPMILYIPVTILRNNMGYLSDLFAPEIIMGVLGIGILAGTFIVDGLVTMATTLIFLEGVGEE